MAPEQIAWLVEKHRAGLCGECDEPLWYKEGVEAAVAEAAAEERSTCIQTLQNTIDWMKARTQEDGTVSGPDMFCSEIGYLERAINQLQANK